MEAEREKRIKQYRFEDIIGESDCFTEMLRRAKKAAQNDANVSIYGETGTGKELVAQSIHFSGARRQGPFLAQNCAALPENLLEGILFGTAVGGFTGAVNREGIFAQAQGGTLLLDEISAMPYELQGKLLRVLQESCLRPIGGMRDIPLDVRIIATFNEEAELLIKTGRLRKDLYYRLNIIQIHIPPLRERNGDILLLMDFFLRKYDREYGRDIRKISTEAQKALLEYDFPGNVRELENIIQSAVSVSGVEEEITKRDLLLPENPGRGDVFLEAASHREGLDEFLASMEKEMIEKVLAGTGGNLSQAADRLKIKVETLQHKMEKFNLK